MSAPESNRELAYTELENVAKNLQDELTNQLCELEQLIDETSSKDTCYMFVNGMLTFLENIHTLVNDISTVYGEMSKTNMPVEFMLSARDLCFRYNNCSKTVMSSLNACLSTLRTRNSIDKIYGNPAVRTIYEIESNTEELQFPIDLLQKERENVLNLFRKVKDTANRMTATDLALLERITLGNGIEKFNDELKIYVANSAKSMQKEVLRDLKRQAQSMKEKRTDRLTKEHWGMVLEMEDEMLKQAVKKKLTLSNDERFDSYENAERQSMESNLPLIKKMREIFVEDELFDAGEIPNLNKYLNIQNIKLFVKIVLRGNIIRCNIYPELQPKFDAWIKGQEYVEKAVEKPIETEESNTPPSKRNSESKTKKVSVSALKSKFAMTQWKKLQERGWIDENLQPLTNLQKAAVIASVMGDKLHIKPKWNVFEDLWNVKNLATRLSRALSGSQAGMYVQFQTDLENTLGISHKKE